MKKEIEFACRNCLNVFTDFGQERIEDMMFRNQIKRCQA